MSTTNLKQKLSLVCLGIFLTLLLLELSLRLGGFIFLVMQERANRRGLTDQGVYHILCIGESTTGLGDMFSYPSQLECLLNAKSKTRKFKVINKGVPAVTTSFILNELEENLSLYHPDLVIAMMGVNDETYETDRPNTWWRQLRVVKLYDLLRLHLRQRFHPKKELTPIDQEMIMQDKKAMKHYLNKDYYHNAADTPKYMMQFIDEIDRSLILVERKRKFASEKYRNATAQVIVQLQDNRNTLLVELGLWYEDQGMFPEAERFLAKACELHPRDARALLELGRFYKRQKKLDQAISCFQRVVSLTPNKRTVDGFVELGRIHDELGDVKNARAIFQNLVGVEAVPNWIDSELGDWFVGHHLLDIAEKFYLSSLKKGPDNLAMYVKLGDLLTLENRKEEGEKYYQKARQEMDRRYKPITFENYNAIADKILRRGIKLISMQYPMRSVEVLKTKLKEKDKIIFVENRDNFLRALEGGQYSDLFWDNSGGEFGHCTTKGNRLIAENLTRVILGEILKEPQSNP